MFLVLMWEFVLLFLLVIVKVVFVLVNFFDVCFWFGLFIVFVWVLLFNELYILDILFVLL